MQDNRGSLNQDQPSFQFWNALAIKITQSLIQPTDKSAEKLNIGLAIDHTRNIKNKNFTLLSAMNNENLGNTLATGNKITFENNVDYSNKIGSHYYTLEYELLYSNYSNQNLDVSGGYGQMQF